MVGVVDIVLEENLISTPITVAQDKTTVKISYAGDKTLVVQLDPFQVRGADPAKVMMGG